MLLNAHLAGLWSFRSQLLARYDGDESVAASGQSGWDRVSSALGQNLPGSA